MSGSPAIPPRRSLRHAAYYVPEGEVPPADATHILRLTSMQSPERALRVAVVVKPGFAAFLDALLAMIATQPRTGSEPI